MARRVHRREAEHLPHNAQIAIAEIDDPYEKGARITAVRSIRSDVLGRLHAHHQIDDAQFAAGRKWQRLFEQAVGTIKAIDPCKDTVDGSHREFFSERRIAAMSELAEARACLPFELCHLLYQILIDGMMISAVAALYGYTSARQIAFTGVAFRGALEILAIHFGYAQRRKI